FSYLAHQSPTLCDLVAEKMKPDEDFIVFANRWRTMASRSEVMIPESQAVAMLVTNTTPQLRGILMFSELRSFQQLYNRAKVVQAQIKESMIPNIFESKPPRGRKPASVPTTEGVTINEQVNALHSPSGRPPYRPHPAPTPAYAPPPPGPYLHPAPMPAPTPAYAPPQHGPYFPPAPVPAPAPPYAYPPRQPRPMPVQRQYHNVPPPNAFPRPGQKRINYPPLPEALEDIFAVFMAHGVLNLPPR